MEEIEIKKRNIFIMFGVLVLSLVIFSSTILAFTMSWSNPGTNWQKPYSGTLTSNKDSVYPKVTANLSFYWNTSQASSINSGSFFPTFDLRDDSKSGYDGYYISSNLPNPIYDYEDDNGDGYDDELEVVTLGPVNAYQSYYVNTSWSVKNINDDPAIIAYGNKSTMPLYPGGDFNTVPGTTEYLAGFKYSDLSYSIKNRETVTLASINVNNTSKIDNIEKYNKIITKKDLDDYINTSNEIVSKAVGDEAYDFIITFNRPVSIEDLNEIISKENISIKQIYQ